MAKLDGKNELKRILTGALLGAAVCVALSTAITMFMALFVAAGRVGEGAERTIVVISAFVAAAVGVLAARLKNHGAALLSGIATSALVILVRLLVMLLSETSTTMDGADIAVFLSILCGGLASGAITVHRRRRRR